MSAFIAIQSYLWLMLLKYVSKKGIIKILMWLYNQVLV